MSNTMARRRPKGRPVNGVLLLDKPTNMTSNAALQEVKRLFKAAKAGHTGSLDPLASGLLPICMGEATKVSAFLLDADKRYWTRAKLGVTTTTADAEGEVLKELPVPDLSDADIENALEAFRGEIDQVPPMYSALKHEGRRLYDLARDGIEVERKPRRIRIYDLTLLERGEDTLDLDVHCSKGTYVRTLAEDLGEALACGAHVAGLRRTGVGPYASENMVTLEQLRDLAEQGGLDALDECLLPVDTAVSDWPALNLSADTAYYLRQGQAVVVPKAPASGWVRLYDASEAFIGLGEVQDDGRVAPRRLVAG